MQTGLLSLYVISIYLHLIAENERLDCSCSDSVNVDGYWSSSSAISSWDLPERETGIAVRIP